MSRLLVGLSLVALLLASAAPARAQSALSNCKYYTKTQQDFLRGLPYCEQCIRDEPDNEEARYFGAWCLAEVGRYEDAWPSFKWLIDRSNDKDKNVRKHAKWAAERVQTYFARHFNKGVEYLNANDLKSARAEFLSATQINPTKPEGFLNLGYVDNQLGEADGALDAFRKAIEIAPDSKVSYEYYSVALGRKRDAELARHDALAGELHALRSARRPDSAAVAAKETAVAEAAADVAEVTAELKRTLDRVVANDPSSDAALLQLGDIELAAGNEEAGIEYVQKAIAISPDNVVKLYNIAVGFYQRNEHEKAARAFALVTEHVNDPADDLWRDATYNRGLALKAAAKYPEALECALKLIEAKETEPDYHSLASGIYVLLKKLPEASKHAERAEALRTARVEGAPEEAP